MTNGGAEANYITTWNLVEPGDEVVMMVPNYMQTLGPGARLRRDDQRLAAGRARDGGGWRVDIDALERLVSPRTKLIVICNPNNPTGARFEADDLDRIAAIAIGTAAGSCPTRSTAAPSSTAARRRRCGAAPIA